MGGQLCSHGRGVDAMMNVVTSEMDGPNVHDPLAASLAATPQHLSGPSAGGTFVAAGTSLACGQEDTEVACNAYNSKAVEMLTTDRRGRGFECAHMIPHLFEVRQPSLQDLPGTYLAVQRKTGTVHRFVTIQKPGGSEQQERLRSLVRQFQALRSVGVAKTIDVFEDFRVMTLVMEHCSGGTVFERILQRQYFAEQETSVLIRHMLQSLAHLHRHGLAHGHPTPDSFRFQSETPHASLKLVDYGLELQAHLWEAQQAVEGLGGTRDRRRGVCIQFFETCRIVFAAPEIVRLLRTRSFRPSRTGLSESVGGGDNGEEKDEGLDGDLLAEAIDGFLERSEELDPRQLEAAGAWSVGAIAFLLLCGYPPFFAPCRFAILARIEKTDYAFDPPFWSKISEEAKDFVQSLLRAAPSERMSVEHALRHPWIQNLADTSPSGCMLSSFALNLRRFYRTSLIESFSANSLAGSLNFEELQDLHTKCQEADVQRSGFFTATDLKQVLARLGHNEIAESIAMCYARSLRHPGESYIDYAALVDSVRARRERILEQELWTTFCEFADSQASLTGGDASNDGCTSPGSGDLSVSSHHTASARGRLPIARLYSFLHAPQVREVLAKDGLQDVASVATAIQVCIRHTGVACTSPRGRDRHEAQADAAAGALGMSGVQPGIAGLPTLEVNFIEIVSEVIRQLPPLGIIQPTP